jgi:cytochrome P450
MKSTVVQEFSADPFDPAVMADPLPYYRTLRDEHPVYYVPKWDTYALSRFADIWDVLALNDGTFVASRALPAATVLAHHNDGPVPDPPLHPMPFHANFDSPMYEDVRRCTSGPLRPKPVTKLADRIRVLANERLDVFAAAGRFDLTQDYGGIVAALDRVRVVGLPFELAPMCSPPSTRAVERNPVAGSRWPTPGPAIWSTSPPSSNADGRGGTPNRCRSSTACWPIGCRTDRRCPTSKRRSRCSRSSSAAPRRCKIVAHGLWGWSAPISSPRCAPTSRETFRWSARR